MAKNSFRIVVTKADLEQPSESSNADENERDVKVGVNLVSHAIKMLANDVQTTLRIPIGERSDQAVEPVFLGCAAIYTHNTNGKKSVPVPAPNPKVFDLEKLNADGQLKNVTDGNPPTFYNDLNAAKWDPPQQSGLDVIARFLLDIKN